MLFTFGSPHGGVSVYNKCNKWYCPFVNHTLGYLSELVWIQNWLAPADYFRPYFRLDEFYEDSIFLPELNNEKEIKDEGYKARISALNHFGLWMWDQDRTVVPRQSEWFGRWDSDRNDQPLMQQDLYKEDWLGLKTLYESDRLHFYSGPGAHMHLEDYMINDYLAPLLLGQTPAPSEL